MTAYIFDVDGVITNPQTRTIKHPELISEIIKILENQNPVAFITGRALPWLKKRLLSNFQDYIKINNLEKTMLDNIFISGEFGGCSIVFNNGFPKETVNSSLSLNPELVNRLSEATKQFSDIVFIDQDKQTEFSVEMKQKVTVAQFAKRKHEIASTFNKIVQDLKLEELVEVHEDRIAINIKSKISNKKLSTRQFLDWLSVKNLKPEKILAFGDSISDLEIAEQLKEDNLNFEFIYTGNPDEIKDKTTFPVTFTIEKFGKETDEGTLRYLKTQ